MDLLMMILFGVFDGHLWAWVLDRIVESAQFFER